MEISKESVNLMKKHSIALHESLCVEEEYVMDNALKCQDVLVEAKRIMLNHQFEKITNITLSNTTCQSSKQTSCDNWKVPAPETSLNILKSELKSKRKKQSSETIVDLGFADKIEQIKLKHLELKKDLTLAEKYGKKWKEKINNRKDSNQETYSENKMNKFIKSLQKLKWEKQLKQPKTEHTQKNKNELKSQQINIKELTDITNDDNTTSEKLKSGCYQNRYKAQKRIILMQKYKLLEQERQIEELKYDKLTDKLSKSLENTEKELKEMYSVCSLQTKCKLGIPCKTPIELIELQTHQVPKIVRKMENRAVERAQKRQIIYERKKYLEEERKRIAMNLVEKKHQQDEDDKRRNFEAIKLRRSKELETARKKGIEKEWLRMNIEKADRFYNRRLKKKFIKRLHIMMQIKEESEYKAHIFYDATIQKDTFIKWRRVTLDIQKQKEEKAHRFYKKRIMRKCLEIFKAIQKMTRENYQVAEDYYNYHLQHCVFSAYYIYILHIKKKRQMLLVKATTHYNNRILIQNFYQWKSLKAVLQLEKAKEEKKKKWRERVLEVIPDYKPPIEE